MKITKGGKIRLEKKDYRIGNFVLSIECEHIKIQDLNRCFTLRVVRRLPVGVWLDSLIKRGDDGADSLRTYIAVMWSALSVVPDNEYMRALIDSAREGLSRHPEWYGKKESEDGHEVSDGKEG